MQEEHSDFWDLIADIPIAMVTTNDGGHIRARPMAAFVDKPSRTIQFVTDDDSAKVDELIRDRDLCLSFADQKKMKFASVSGRAALSQDHTLIERLWGPYCEAFFPGGKDAVVVITLDTERGEFWDSDENALKMAYKVTKAYFTNDGPDIGENAKLDL